jgi:hypothetical protein
MKLHFICLHIAYVMSVQNFEFVSDQFNIVGICTCGNCAEKWITELLIIGLYSVLKDVKDSRHHKFFPEHFVFLCLAFDCDSVFLLLPSTCLVHLLLLALQSMMDFGLFYDCCPLVPIQ